MEDYQYDVAISFLNENEQTARELHQRLSPNFRVFAYFDRQDSLAGTDGLESFRKAFYEQSRLAVVLYKSGWGETPWTRVEESAIKDRCLKIGWNGLLFIMVDQASRPPVWLPETNIRLQLADYGIEQAVGAIKSRIESLGGQLQKEDPVDRAKLLQRELQARANRRRLLASQEGVQEAGRQAEKVHGEIRGLVERIRTESAGLSIEAGSDDDMTVVTTRRVSLVVHWRPSYTNTLEHSLLLVREFNGRVLLPQQRGKFITFGEPELLAEHEFDPDLTVDQGWCWRSRFTPECHFTSTEVAEFFMELFLKLVDRADTGDIPPLDPIRRAQSEGPNLSFMAS